MKKGLYKDYLEEITKKDIETIINKFSLLGIEKPDNIKKLKKEDLVKFITGSLKDVMDSILRHINHDRYAALKHIVSSSKVKNTELNRNEKEVVNTLLKYDFLKTWHERNNLYYGMYNDVRKVFSGRINDKTNKNKIKNNKQKQLLIKGIIHAYGAITLENAYLLLQQEYPRLEESQLLENVKKHLVLNDDFKLSETKDNTILYSKNFKTITSTKKFVKKDIYGYTYEEYLSWGCSDFKYNNEFKKFYKLLKKKYIFTKNDLAEFNRYDLCKYTELYQINKKQAETFIKDIIKEKFEFKDSALEDKLVKQAVLIADNEPRWGS